MFDGCRDAAAAAGAAPEPRPIDPDATATVMYTSGTTAGPKAVALSYDNWLWNAIGSALALGLDPDERWLCPMPLAHVGGLSIQIRSAIYGTTVLLHDRFDIERALAALMDARPAGDAGLAGADDALAPARRRPARAADAALGAAGRRPDRAGAARARPRARACPWLRPTG